MWCFKRMLLTKSTFQPVYTEILYLKIFLTPLSLALPTAPNTPTFVSKTISQIVVMFTKLHDDNGDLVYNAKAVDDRNHETTGTCELVGITCTVDHLHPGSNYSLGVRACIKDRNPAICGEYSSPLLPVFTIPSSKVSTFAYYPACFQFTSTE